MAIERSIIDAASRLRRNREAHVIATVVRVQGSGYRRPGARMLLTQFRWISGSASGGGLEGDLASTAWKRTRDGEPVVVSYDPRLPENATDDDVRAAFGLGCDGIVDVMLERAGTPGRVDPLEFAERCLRSQRRGAVATVIRSEAPGLRPGMRVAVMTGEAAMGDSFDAALRAGMIADARAAIATGESNNRTYRSDQGNIDVFVEAILPPPHLYIFGTGHDAVPVVAMAKTLGWDVSICTTEARVAVCRRFSQADQVLVGDPFEIAARVDESDRAVAIVMGHHYATDRENLSMLVGTQCRYIGVLGPRGRTQRMLAELGLGLMSDPRIHAPIGLEIGADTPQEIALAIVGEIQSVLTHAPGFKSRDRISSIHPSRRMPRISEAVEAAGPVTGTHKRISQEIETQAPAAS